MTQSTKDISRQNLSAIKILYRQPDTMALWGLPYDLRPGQSPRHLWDSRTIPDTCAQAAGRYGFTLAAPGPREGWIWLGSPGWYGTMTRRDQVRVRAFLDQHDEFVPGGPGEWCVLPRARCSFRGVDGKRCWRHVEHAGAHTTQKSFAEGLDDAEAVQPAREDEQLRKSGVWS